MNHTDHVNLIRPGIQPHSTSETWADFGSGGGAFTLALAELLPTATLYSIDRDSSALDQQHKAMSAQFPAQTVIYRTTDFTRKLDLPLLDGVLMANSLHFIRDKAPVLELVRGYLKPGGRLMLVEYNTDQGNTWVPYPLTFESWAALAAKNGFSGTRKLSARPSRFLGEIYSALSMKSDMPLD
ncbi:MAG: class I SAM-dependent methyltransferase [Chloroflexota bacterium]